MCAAFLGILYGNDLFGLLSSRAALVLGHISYSVYLLHFIVFCTIRMALDTVLPLGMLSPVPYWLLVAGVGLLVVGISTLTYLFIEYPSLRRPVGPVV